MNFTKGDTVHHSLHGIGTIRDVQVKELLGSKIKFAILYFEREQLEMMVPIGDLPAKVRSPIDESQAQKVLTHLEEWDGNLAKEWKTRNRRNQERLESGDPMELSHIVKGLTVLQEKKGRLNSSDQRQLDRSLALLAEELAVALGTTPEAMNERLATCCSSADAA